MLNDFPLIGWYIIAASFVPVICLLAGAKLLDKGYLQ